MLQKRLWLILVVLVTITSISGCQSPWLDPPDSFQASDLVGAWQATYSVGDTDTLILREDGTFKQLYVAPRFDNYRFETSWQDWKIERLMNGKVRLHLQGARFYIIGITWAERAGRGPCPEQEPDCVTGKRAYSFYDPFSKELIPMLDELVLNVRMTSSGEVILHHNWISSDRGFALIGGNQEIFHRMKEIIE